ncbi:MAG TPA: translocation/assembly module TamB domain-containing protein, partial [Prolixibacteraceae bacterium]|nr:translocation/assembly module TamB domain-containing protein [Prolixibacteraceae bacterium]
DRLILEDVYLSDQKKDTMLYVGKMIAGIDSFSFSNQFLTVKNLDLHQYVLNIEKTDSATYNFTYLADLFTGDSLQNNWKISANDFDFNNGRFIYYDSLMKASVAEFLRFRDMSFFIDQVHYQSGESFSGNLNSLSFVSDSKLTMNNFTSEVEYSGNKLSLRNIQGNTAYSELQSDSVFLLFDEYMISNDVSDISFNMMLNKLNVGFSDLSFLFDGFYQRAFSAQVEGHVRGTLDDMRGRNFKLQVEDFTRLNGDFYINGLPDIQNTYIFFDLNESFANLTEIRNLDLPSNIQKTVNELPSFLDNVGVFSYQGNFTGFLDNFVAYGTAYSNLGTFTTDVSFKPLKNEQLQIAGNLQAVDLNIGKVFRNDNFDKLSFSGQIDGTVNRQAQYNLEFDGLVNSIDFKGYEYDSISVKGSLKNDLFNGTLSIIDPNLKLDYRGKLDMHPKMPVFEFFANVEYVNLTNLMLVESDEEVLGAVKVDANFKGNTIDDAEGRLLFSDFFFKNKNGNVNISEIQLNNSPVGRDGKLTLQSDLIDAEVTGVYRFMTLQRSLKEFYSSYLPSSLNRTKKNIDDPNDFHFHVHLKNFSAITSLISADFNIDENVEIEGTYAPFKNEATLETFIPYIKHGKRGGENISVRIDADEEELFSRSNFDKLWLNSKFNLYNFTISANAQNDQLGVDFFWNNYSPKTYSGTIETTTKFTKTSTTSPRVEIDLEPSDIYIGDSLWQVRKSRVQIDSTSVLFEDIEVSHKNERLLINGRLAENDNEFLDVRIDHVGMQLFEPLLGNSSFTGELNGQAQISSFYDKFILDMDLSMNKFSYNHKQIGDLVMSSRWDHEREELYSELFLADSTTSLLEASGYIDPVDGDLDLNIEAEKAPLSVLDIFMPPTFYAMSGDVKGDIYLHGNVNHIMLDGAFDPIEEATIGVSYLKTIYSFEDPVVFGSDSIIFPNLLIKDEMGNTGGFYGNIVHRSFNDMSFDLSVYTNYIMAMNTSFTDNEYLYGKGFISGVVNIDGYDDDVEISGDVRSEKGTSIFIPFESSSGIEQYDFIEFVNNEADGEVKEQYNVPTSDFNFNFDFEITPDASVQLIFSSQYGDVIKSVGNGNLQVRIDKNYNIDLYGNYTIVEGGYLFSLQNLINKRFAIQEGSTIEWVGDPYNAMIDITAIYRLKTSLKDLFVENYENIDLERRIPVECIIRLSEELVQPEIDFSIDLPTAEERVNDRVQQVIATPEEVNKQMISLLMIGRFYTPEIFAGIPNTTNTGAELVGTTATELISNQLSNWLSQISDNLDLGINYRPGNEASNDQIELALSTQIFNDRVTINGNIANNTKQTSTNDSEFIGDVDLNVKLTDNGKLQLKVYNRANDNLIYDTAPYTQGVGFSYREEFNSFKELFRRYTAFLSRKKRNEAKAGDEEN